MKTQIYGVAALLGAIAAMAPSSHAATISSPNATGGTSDVRLVAGNYATIEAIDDSAAKMQPDQNDYAALNNGTVGGGGMSITVNTNSGTGASLLFRGEAGTIVNGKIRANDINVSATRIAVSSGSIPTANLGSVASTYQTPGTVLPTSDALLWKNSTTTSTATDIGNVRLNLSLVIKNLALYPGSSSSGAGTKEYRNQVTFTLAVNPS
ncbi:MAG TPA: hypothetical protein VGA96_03885 [Fibrella sp.]|jgi:hypothetical protein